MSMNYDCTGNSCDCLQGVKCDVTSCIHNNQQCGCTAQQIRGGTSYATKADQTICDTFEQQK